MVVVVVDDVVVAVVVVVAKGDPFSVKLIPGFVFLLRGPEPLLLTPAVLRSNIITITQITASQNHT